MAEEKKEVIKKKKQVPAHSTFEDTKKKLRDCPKCGPGYSLANHKNRKTCGNCGYTEFLSQKEVKKE